MTENHVVKHPAHYEIIPWIQAKDIIKATLNNLELSPWEGYVLGNIMKYRLRAGNKDALEQDISKANEYKSWVGTDSVRGDHEPYWVRQYTRRETGNELVEQYLEPPTTDDAIGVNP